MIHLLIPLSVLVLGGGIALLGLARKDGAGNPRALRAGGLMLIIAAIAIFVLAIWMMFRRFEPMMS